MPSLSRTSGSEITLLIATWIFCTTSGGVPPGAKTPYQGVYSKPSTPASASVGRFGSAGERFLPEVAIGRSDPAVR